MTTFRRRAVGSVLAVVVLASQGALTARQPAADGEIAGRISDASGATIPGVRIVINSIEGRREAVTDRDGLFRLVGLQLGTYRVETALAGFIPRSGTLNLTPEARRAYVTWPIEVGCIQEDITVVFDARGAAPIADSILHVRVTSDSGAWLWSQRPECPPSVVQSYTVEVVNTIVRRRTSPEHATREIVLSQRADRLTPRQEYVVFFWDESLVGTGLVFPITSGRISSGGLLGGMRVDEAVKTLRRWARDRPR